MGTIFLALLMCGLVSQASAQDRKQSELSPGDFAGPLKKMKSE
jgi:hypothetical protein